MVLECIPAGVARVITQSVNAVTIGCGAGPHVDGQNLNAYDILGLFEKFVPKFVKQYAVLAPQVMDAFDGFSRDVKTGDYPSMDHSFTGGNDILNRYPAK
jgi:3-methyl-2-oxobutanoate hydroxymethyltransferase